MTISNIISRVNAKMDYDQFSYDALIGSFDSAIDNLNVMWRLNLPVITDTPEMVPDTENINNMIPGEYDALPDDFIRMYVVPFVAGAQYIQGGQDGSTEMNEAMINLGKLSERYPVDPGQTKIENVNYDVIVEDRSGYFGDGNSNYQKSDSGYIGPLTPEDKYG